MAQPAVRYQLALDLFTESVIKPDHELRIDAADKGVYAELMEIRQHVLTYLTTLKEVHSIEMGDESDDLETSKTLLTKQAAQRL